MYTYKQLHLTLRTCAFFISICILGILTLSNAKNPLLVEFIPNLLPISPIVMPNTITVKILIYLLIHIIDLFYYITRHWHPCLFISNLHYKWVYTITFFVCVKLSHYYCIIAGMSN